MKGVFVTATGTEVGKTLVSCAIARFLSNRGFSPGVMKPVASGGMVMTVSGKKRLVSQDAVDLKDAARTDDPLDRINPVCYRRPLAPYSASIIEKKRFSLPRIMRAYRDLRAGHSTVIVEGIGGVSVPLAKDFEVSDLMAEIGLPAIVVASSRLGTLNHTFLTLDYLSKRKIKVLGIVLNFYDSREVTAVTNLRCFMERKITVLATFRDRSRLARDFDLAARELEMTFLGRWISRDRS